ncbi:hypothetical protein G7Y89_g3408 [Cudoniella acicularis]|uniref:Uncharacterized protein n=1 Tax=Cudoniella acicularis TaxID=354080 RepID=A0A8H4RSQ5_9HELO|nr:hypothetical protein G7Y89_g3408 [Cudoniella acicularis]
MSLFRRFGREKGTEQATTSGREIQGEVLQEGNLKYAIEQGGNGSLPSYQEVTGAPVERLSPLGYAVGPVTIMFLNISMMIGTGVYSTPASVLSGTGSVGLSMIYWFLGFLIASSSLSVYLEYASYFPNRSGSETVYLEASISPSEIFFPDSICCSVILAQYLYKINGHTPTNWELKGVAIAGYSVAVLLLLFHTRFSFWLSNGIGIVKVLTLVFIAITGLVVLGGHTAVKNPTINFQNAFESSGTTPYGVTNALVKIIFSYAGYQNAFNVVNEVKLELFETTLLFPFSKTDLRTSSQVAAALFFQNVFGNSGAVRGLNFLIALSAFGNLLAVLIGQSRLIRECGRQGVLPYPRFWASTRPFGTPTGPYFVKWALTVLMILAPPAGDAFNFIVDLQNYPAAFFNVTMAIGLYIVRYRRKKLALPRTEFRAWDFVVIFNILTNLYILIMPWYPPAKGRAGGDVSFCLVICGLYYSAWVYILPKFGGYQIRQEVIDLGDGATTHKLVKVPNEELARWDETHDAVGRSLTEATQGGSDKDSQQTPQGEKV